MSLIVRQIMDGQEQLSPLGSELVQFLICLVLPLGCFCEREGAIYRITCPEEGIASRVWENRREIIYPLLKRGDVLEVLGSGYHSMSYPLPEF